MMSAGEEHAEGTTQDSQTAGDEKEKEIIIYTEQSKKKSYWTSFED